MIVVGRRPAGRRWRSTARCRTGRRAGRRRCARPGVTGPDRQCPVGRLRQHGAARRVAVPQVVDDRHHDGDEDPDFDAEHHHGERGEHGDDELGPPHGQYPTHACDVDELDADEEHDGGERGQRQPGKQRGGHQAHHDDHGTTDTSCATWLRPPAPTTICVFVGLPLTTNVPVTAAARLAAAEREQVGVGVDLLVEPRRVGPRGRRTLSEDHDEHRGGEWAARRPGRRGRSAGSARPGSPAGTAPSTATPRSDSPRTASATIAATTASSATGIRRSTALPTSTARPPRPPTSRVGRWVCGSSPSDP